MEINQEQEENDQDKNAQPPRLVQDVFQLEAGQAKVNEGDWEKKEKIVKDRMVGDELDEETGAGAEKIGEIKWRPQENQKKRREDRMVAEKTEDSPRPEVAGQVMDSFNGVDLIH